MKALSALGSLIAALAALSLAACDSADNRIKTGQARTPPPASAAPSVPVQPPSQTAQADTKVDAKAGETANANDEPMKSMTKEEETKAMPQPGQNNDHSTLAKDPKQSTETK